MPLSRPGAEVRSIEYGPVDPELNASGRATEVQAMLVTAVHDPLSARLEEQSWPTLTMIGKSRGTLVMAGLPRPNVDQVNAVWLTPMLGWPEVLQGMLARDWPSLIVAGTADPLHNESAFRHAERALGASSLLIPDDHERDCRAVASDVRKKLERWRSWVEELEDHPLDRFENSKQCWPHVKR